MEAPSLVDAYVEHLRAGSCLPARIKRVKNALAHYRRFLGAQGTSTGDLSEAIRAATTRDLVRFAGYLIEEARTPQGRPLAGRTQEGYFRTVVHLFRFLARSGRVLTDASAGLPRWKQPERLPPAVPTQPEMQGILERPRLDTKVGLRDRAILETLYSTGLRRAELTNLSVYDVDLATRMVRVRLGKNRRDRLVPLGRVAARWLAEYLERARPELVPDGTEIALFLGREGRPLRPARLSDLARKYARQALVEKKVSCHTFRHAFATHLLQEGAGVRAIQAMLGHASLMATQIYTRVAAQDVIRAIEKYHPLERKGFLVERAAAAEPPARTERGALLKRRVRRRCRQSREGGAGAAE